MSGFARQLLTGGALLLATCGPPSRDGDTQAQPHLSQSAELFAPDVISDERWQYRITFTPDGRTAYWSVAEAFFPQSRRATIHMAALGDDGVWSQPEVAPFSGTFPDMDPFITVDGNRLYFSSIRPLDGVAREDMDLFYMERTAAGWGEPVRLGPEVNTGLDELYPSLDREGTLYFASGPPAPTPDTNWNIYSAARTASGFVRREPVHAVNIRLPWDATAPTADWQFNPEVSPDGRMLLFTSLRSGGHGSGDIYVSHRAAHGAWGEPVNLGPPVNTAADEFHPTLSRDGRTLYFARTVLSPEVVPGSFYSVPVAAIRALDPRATQP